MKKAIVVTAVLLLSGAGCLSTSGQITTFEQCAAAGNPVMESYPRQCRANGQTFVETIAVPPTPSPQTGGKEAAFQYGQATTLGVDETASFADGLRVLLQSINDSRCKPGVVCVWAGELGATLKMQVGDGASQELILGTTTKPMNSALGYDVTLVSVTETTATISITKQKME